MTSALPRQGFSRTPPRRLTAEELERRFYESCPELFGPGVDTESGQVLYGQPGHPRIGPVPVQAGTSRAEREAEAAQRAAADANLPPEVRAARDLLETQLRQERRGSW